jgi:hypothetical protein
MPYWLIVAAGTVAWDWRKARRRRARQGAHLLRAFEASKRAQFVLTRVDDHDVHIHIVRRPR